MVIDAYRIAIKVMIKMKSLYPNKTFNGGNGEQITLDEAIHMFERVVDWVYPALDSDDIEKVVRCKNCIHYKKYKKKGDFKSQPFYACSLNKVKRPPNFFCKDGEES